MMLHALGTVGWAVAAVIWTYDATKLHKSKNTLGVCFSCVVVLLCLLNVFIAAWH